MTVNQITNPISINHECVKNILQNKLGMMEVSAQWVSSIMTSFQKYIILITTW